MTDNENPAFSYPLKVSQISASTTALKLSANDRERERLAKLWDVSQVLHLSADLQIARWKKDGLRLKGAVTARIVQACVVTLEPVESGISETIDMTFVPEGSRLAKALQKESETAVIDPEGPDLPDLFVGDTVDVGAAVAEQAALAIDPYPRKPGVSFGDRIESSGDDDKRPNPFAVLEGWKKD